MRRWGAAAVLWIGLAPVAGAQSLVAPNQPEVLPSRVFITPHIAAYADPSMPAEQTGLRDVSTRAVQVEILRQLAADPRFEVVSARDTHAAMLELSAQQDIATSLRFGESFTELGVNAFTAYNLQIAIEQFESAITNLRATFAPWVTPTTLADPWHYLALVYAEIAGGDQDAYDAVAQMQRAFAELIRVAPTRPIGTDQYPESIVHAHRTAYAQLLADGTSLGLSHQEASWLAESLDADLIVDVALMTDSAGTRVHTSVWDQDRATFATSAVVQVDATTEAIANAVTLAISEVAACRELVHPPVADAVDRGAVYLTPRGAVLRNAAADTVFYSYGFYAGGAYLFNDTVGVGLAGSLVYGQRDEELLILRAPDTVQGRVSAVFATRTGPARFSFDTGIELAHTTELWATDNFWCRVSGGDVVVFDEDRQCRDSDVFNQSPQLRGGVHVGAQADLHLAGPFWVSASVGAAFYAFPPSSDRGVDFPIDAGSGLTYRF